MHLLKLFYMSLIYVTVKAYLVLSRDVNKNEISYINVCGNQKMVL